MGTPLCAVWSSILQEVLGRVGRVGTQHDLPQRGSTTVSPSDRSARWSAELTSPGGLWGPTSS